jgi:hypothetical protein
LRRCPVPLLLYPEFPDTFWSFKHALKFVGKKGVGSPAARLLTVAAMLPPEWEKRLVDLNVRRAQDKDLAWADVVFISAMIVQRDSARRLIARCKAAGKTSWPAARCSRASTSSSRRWTTSCSTRPR